MAEIEVNWYEGPFESETTARSSKEVQAAVQQQSNLGRNEAADTHKTLW